MPIDYENMRQYTTPLHCPECREHIFQTDAKPSSALAFIEAECTSCGHPLTRQEIEAQVEVLPPALIQAMIVKYRGGKSDESL